ncbi:MAG: hypothetical protein QM496_05220 [Verrucomicrobiota bacterium]
MSALIASLMNPIFACAVCTGSIDDAQTNAANMGIWVMLVVLMGVLSCIVGFIINLARRSRQLELETVGTDIKHR